MTAPTVLHYYRCRICAGIIITGIKASNYEPCNGCQSYARWLFSRPVETPEQRDCAELVAKQGRVYRFSPRGEPMAYTPSRREFPPETAAQRAGTAQEDEARMEAAYQAAEQGKP
jgi:hypothetical protein